MDNLEETVRDIDHMLRYVPQELQAHHGTDYMHRYVKMYLVAYVQREAQVLGERGLIWEQKNRKELQK